MTGNWLSKTLRPPLPRPRPPVRPWLRAMPMAPRGDRQPSATLGHLPEHLPRIEQVIEPGHKVCPCGCTDMVKIGEDRVGRLDIIPARFQVIVTVRPRYACRRCDGGVLQGGPLCAIGSRTMASAPAHLIEGGRIEGGLPTEGTLAGPWPRWGRVSPEEHPGARAGSGSRQDQDRLSLGADPGW